MKIKSTLLGLFFFMGLSMNAQTTVDSYTSEPAAAVKYISINENGNESEVYLKIL